MFGSRKEPKLMGGRKVILSLASDGMSLSEAMQSLSECVADYAGDRAELRFGYWEYGDEIVVTAPEDAK